MDELRQAALDGSIEQLIDWRPVEAGEFYIIPPGTVHAIGAGISLLEFQQNAAITYRLYDYGRPRELHLDDGVTVAARAQFPEDCARPAEAPTDAVLLNGPLFSLVRASSAHLISASLGGTRRWVMPIEGTVTSGNETASTGECLLLDAGAALKFEAQAIALIGVEGRVCSRAADSNSRTPSEAALSATSDVETRSLGTGTGTVPQRKLDP